MPNPTIYYIRHGETDWNAEQRFQGRRDIPLNALGQSQADENGRKLKELLGTGEGLDFIASPLGRTRETMERVRAGMGLPPEGFRTDDLLLEISYGDFEGRTLSDLKANDNELHRYRKANAWIFQPPNGESHEMALERVARWYESLNGDCVVVAHGAIGRVVRYHLLELDKQEAARYPFPQDKICILSKGKERLY